MDPRSPEDRHRRLLIAALGAELLGAPQGARAQAQILGSRPGPLPSGQSIYRLRGSVTVDGQQATLQTVVRPDSVIETAAGSEVIFVVGTRSILLRAGSRLELQGQPQPGGSAFVGALRLLTGKLLQVSRNDPLRFTTRTATIGVRGTGWYAEAEADLTYFCTCYGSAEIAAADDPASRATVSTQQHDWPLYILAEGPQGQRIRNAPFINHTDQELALVEALVGRLTPNVFPRQDYNAPRREY